MAEVVVPSHSFGVLVARMVSSKADCRYSTGSGVAVAERLRSISRAQKCRRSLDQSLLNQDDR